MKWIDAAALEAEINHFLPWIRFIVGFTPGVFGNVLLAFVKLVYNPNFIEPIVQLINQLSGATPPAAASVYRSAAPMPHVWDDEA